MARKSRGKSSEERERIRRETEAKRNVEKPRDDHDHARGKQIGKMALANLSKDRLTGDEFSAALKLISQESDRGCAIMGAALIENALKSVLDATLILRQDEEALYFDQGAPFGTLKNKTVVAFALGLITTPTRSDIDTIRSIRNQFSHALRPLDFSNPGIDAACKKLAHRLKGLESAKLGWNQGAARHAYQIACSEIFREILTRAGDIYSTKIERSRHLSGGILGATRRQ